MILSGSTRHRQQSGLGAARRAGYYVLTRSVSHVGSVVVVCREVADADRLVAVQFLQPQVDVCEFLA